MTTGKTIALSRWTFVDKVMFLLFNMLSRLEKTLEGLLGYREILPVHPKGDSPGCSSEGLMLKLKLQYFGHIMQRVDSFEKTLMVGKIEGRRRRG